MDQFEQLPFSQTHVSLYKKCIDSINAERFTIWQMAKKFDATPHMKFWKDNCHWESKSELSTLLMDYMPDSQHDGSISYRSAMGVGLLLCSGRAYDKAKALCELVEQSVQDSQEKLVYKNDDYLKLLIFTMIEFATSLSRKFVHRQKENSNESPIIIKSMLASHNHSLITNTDEQHPSNVFLECLFGDADSLSKMDFTILL